MPYSGVTWVCPERCLVNTKLAGIFVDPAATKYHSGTTVILLFYPFLGVAILNHKTIFFCCYLFIYLCIYLFIACIQVLFDPCLHVPKPKGPLASWPLHILHQITQHAVVHEADAPLSPYKVLGWKLLGSAPGIVASSVNVHETHLDYH